MTANEYQKEALRTEGNYPGIHKVVNEFPNKACGYVSRLANGLMGLNGEAGEAIDILKKYMFQDHELNREHLAKKLGDVAWYLDGFDSERSTHRKEGDLQ